VSDGAGNSALIEVKTVHLGNTRTGNDLISVYRYQYSNHLGSATLELNENQDLISYEEYYPFGSTSYQMHTNDTEVSQKRYRYCGKEKDNESGLYYYGARYYADWLCRFTAVDPRAASFPYQSSFVYAANSPTTLTDVNGEYAGGPEDKSNEVVFNINITPSLNTEGESVPLVDVDTNVTENTNDPSYRFFIQVNGGEKIEFFPTQAHNTNLPNDYSYAAAEAGAPLTQGPALFGLIPTSIDDYTLLGLLSQTSSEFQQYASENDFLSRPVRGSMAKADSLDLTEKLLTAQEAVYAIIGGYAVLKGIGKFALKQYAKQSLKSNLKSSVDEVAGSEFDGILSPNRILAQELSAAKGIIPRGFSNAKQFTQAGDELAMALKESGLGYNQIGVRGSSVTGVSSKGGGFRVGGSNPSDIDVFIEFSGNVGLNSSKNIPGFIHPGKLMNKYPALRQWSQKWSKILGREITPGGFQPGTTTDPNVIKF